MKIYEFIYSDNTNLTESEVLASAQELMKEEALLQNWAPGYNLRQCQKAKQLEDGTVEYSFEVLGEFQADGQSSDTKASSSSPNTKPDMAASP